MLGLVGVALDHGDALAFLARFLRGRSVIFLRLWCAQKEEK
jgi:hypothetical protein